MTKSPWWPLKLALVMVFWLSLIGVATQPRAQSAPVASSSSPTCHGRFPNIITDICWSCVFPIRVAGVNMLTKTLAHELGPKTRINTILPGFVPTETVKIALNMTDDDFPALEQQLNLPAGRLGTPEDIGAAALYLCSPASAWVTGQCLRIAGTP